MICDTLKVKLVALILCGALNVTFAASLPNHYPINFGEAGSIDRIDFNRQEIVVGDQQYRLHPGIAVHRLHTTGLGSFSNLSTGKNVGCSITVDGNLTDLWMLPDDYDFNENDG